MRGFPVSLRRRWARLLRSTGPYVSGRTSIGMQDTSAMKNPTQKVQRQETTETKPEIMGANCGPHAVALVWLIDRLEGLDEENILP